MILSKGYCGQASQLLIGFKEKKVKFPKEEILA